MKEKIMNISVMGTEYSVFVSTPEKDERLKAYDGYIDPEAKTIVLDGGNKPLHQQKVLTHEITHAFMYESGLDVESWASNEEIVDWIALQLDKISKTTNESLRKLKPYYAKAKEGRAYGEENE